MTTLVSRAVVQAMEEIAAAQAAKPAFAPGDVVVCVESDDPQHEFTQALFKKGCLYTVIGFAAFAPGQSPTGENDGFLQFAEFGPGPVFLSRRFRKL